MDKNEAIMQAAEFAKVVRTVGETLNGKFGVYRRFLIVDEPGVRTKLLELCENAGFHQSFSSSTMDKFEIVFSDELAEKYGAKTLMFSFPGADFVDLLGVKSCGFAMSKTTEIRDSGRILDYVPTITAVVY